MNQQLEKLKSRIAAKQSERDELATKVSSLDNVLTNLRLAARFIESDPECSADRLDAVADILRTLQAEDDVQRNGHAPPVEPATPPVCLAGKTIVECAEIILAERGEKMSYKEIAAEAVRRGYKSGREGRGDDTVVSSFSQILRRNSGPGSPIVKAGEGYFELAEKQEAKVSNGRAEGETAATIH